MKYLLLLIPFLSFAQQTKSVDFTSLSADLVINPSEKKLVGKLTYQFNVISNIDTIRIDAKTMDFESVMINNQEVKFKNSGKELQLFEGYKIGKNVLTFVYTVAPKQTLYFTGKGDDLQVWTQGQGKYTSYWLPSFDDVNEKLIFSIGITVDKRYTALANGEFQSKEGRFNNMEYYWTYQMKKPMSSYLVMLAIGKFAKKDAVSKSGIPLEWYYCPADETKFEPTYRYSKEIFDYLEKEIGVKYPWKIYRQIPVRDFLYAGMENTTSTLFAQDFVIDSISYNDRNYANVNAHELAHHWFGDLVTATSGTHHWLQEGFATYYALLAEKQLFGDDYFNYQLYRNALQLRNASKTDTIPVLNEKASSLSFYQKGAWALHIIRESIGEKKFRKAVKKYLNTYQFQNVSTDDFLNEIKKVSDFDTDNFKKTWLEEGSFSMATCTELLKKNAFMQVLYEVQSYKSKDFKDKQEYFTQLMTASNYYPVKVEMLYQLKNVAFEEKQALLELALKTNDIKVRQAVANTLVKVPASFKLQYESLLNDLSYETKEIAFTHLWESFPEDRTSYLAIAKTWEGNNDKALRILYLTFAQASPEINETEKLSLYKELQNYTAPTFESSIRLNAFESLFAINPNDEVALQNLVNATTHFKWQVVKYARDKIRELIKKEYYLNFYKALLPKLSEEEHFQLERLLPK